MLNSQLYRVVVTLTADKIVAATSQDQALQLSMSSDYFYSCNERGFWDEQVEITLVDRAANESNA